MVAALRRGKPCKVLCPSLRTPLAASPQVILRSPGKTKPNTIQVLDYVNIEPKSSQIIPVIKGRIEFASLFSNQAGIR